MSRTRITPEDLGDATAELLALRFVAGGLDPRRVTELAVLREQLGTLDDETSHGPGRRLVEPWRRLLASSKALRARLEVEDPLERQLAWGQLQEFEALVDERIRLEERRPRWSSRTQWHIQRRELEGRIDGRLTWIIADVGRLARELAEAES
jgi:hypothetical protein